MLTSEQINHFQQKGWVGPLNIFSPAKIAAVKNCLETYSRLIVEADGQEIISFYNNIYHLETPRDLHLFHEPIANLFTDLALIEFLRQIAGNDILLWYTNVFCKLPGQGEIKWHQAKEYYTSSDISAHKTVWQREQKYSLSYDFNERDWPLETVPVKAGQALIFTEKVMHRSFPNQSNRRRLAIIGRYVRPSTQVYPYRWQGNFIDENGHNIERHYCFLVSGEDKYGQNIIRPGHDLSKEEYQFENCLNQVRFAQVQIPEDKQQLEIYALEKQAIEGDCQEEEPNPILHPRKYIQWKVWDQYRGMSRHEAMKKYTQLVATFPVKNQTKITSDEENIAKSSNNTVGEIEAWLISYLSEGLDLDTEEIDVESSFQSYGLSSAEGVGMIGDLSDWLGTKLNPALIYEYSNISALAAKLAQKNRINSEEGQ